MTPGHDPKTCRSCGASIFWAQVVGAGGDLEKKPNGRPKAIPVDATPSDRGNVVLFDRGGSVVARVLGRGEQPPPGAKLRMPHFATCPQAKAWRKGRR